MIANVYKIISQSICNSLDSGRQNIIPEDIVNYIKKRIETDGFLLAEKDNFSKDSKFYYNMSIFNVTDNLSEAYIYSGKFDSHKIGCESPIHYHFWRQAVNDENLTKHLKPGEFDKEISERIVNILWKK